MSTHFVTKCSCGQVIAQCRCFSQDKTVTVIQDGCEKCKTAETMPQTPTGDLSRKENLVQ